METATRSRTTASRGMHPKFVELFLTPDDDDPQADGARRPARRTRRVRVRRSTPASDGQRR